MRNSSKKLKTLRYHADQISKLEFSPIINNLLVSSGNDNKICVWNININEEDCEPIFVHHGHLSQINDFSLNKNYSIDNKQLIEIASVSNDNILQAWIPAFENIVEIKQ